MTDGTKCKSVGIVKLNLGEFIEEGDTTSLKRTLLEKCPDKTAWVEFTLRTTLIAANS